MPRHSRSAGYAGVWRRGGGVVTGVLACTTSGSTAPSAGVIALTSEQQRDASAEGPLLAF